MQADKTSNLCTTKLSDFYALEIWNEVATEETISARTPKYK